MIQNPVEGVRGKSCPPAGPGRSPWRVQGGALAGAGRSPAGVWGEAPAIAPVLALLGPLTLLAPGLADEPAAWVVAALAMGLLGLAQSDAAKALRLRGWESAGLYAACLGLCLVLYLPWLSAKWSIIDDHELFLLLGGKSRLTFFEAAKAFAGHYEVWGIFENSLGRFRPPYYLLRFFNLAAFGDDVAAWNRLDFALFAASLCLAGLSLRRAFGLAETMLALVAALSLPFWPGVLFSNLQQEAPALLGLCLFAHGLARVSWGNAVAARSINPERAASSGSLELRESHASPASFVSGPDGCDAMPGSAGVGNPAGKPAPASVWPWAEACLGALVAMGMKENFLILAPVLAVAALAAWRRKAISRPDFFCVLAALAYAALAASVLAWLLARQGTDMYANPVSAGSRLALVWPGLTLFAALARADIALALALPFLLLGFWSFKRGRNPRFRRDLGRALVVLGLCAAGFASQYVFYSGQIPIGVHRYDFPAMLAPPASWLALAWLAARCLRHAGSSRLRRAAPMLVCAGLAFFAASNGFDAWRSNLRLALAKTRVFDARIGAVAIYAKAEPDRPLVLYAHNPDSIEAVDSVVVYLRKRFHATNPIFLDYRRPAAQPDSAHLQNLNAELARLSREGSSEIMPLANLPTDIKPLGLGFDGPPGQGSASLGRIWPLP